MSIMLYDPVNNVSKVIKQLPESTNSYNSRTLIYNNVLYINININSSTILYAKIIDYNQYNFDSTNPGIPNKPCIFNDYYIFWYNDDDLSVRIFDTNSALI